MWEGGRRSGAARCVSCGPVSSGRVRTGPGCRLAGDEVSPKHSRVLSVSPRLSRVREPSGPHVNCTKTITRQILPARLRHTVERRPGAADGSAKPRAEGHRPSGNQPQSAPSLTSADIPLTSRHTTSSSAPIQPPAFRPRPAAGELRHSLTALMNLPRPLGQRGRAVHGADRGRVGTCAPVPFADTAAPQWSVPRLPNS